MFNCNLQYEYFSEEKKLRMYCETSDLFYGTTEVADILDIYATSLANYCNGANIKAVSGHLGHSQLSTTNRYLHIIQAADGSIAEGFNNLFDKSKKDKKMSGVNPRTYFFKNGHHVAFLQY